MAQVSHNNGVAVKTSPKINLARSKMGLLMAPEILVIFIIFSQTLSRLKKQNYLKTIIYPTLLNRDKISTDDLNTDKISRKFWNLPL